MSPTDTAERKLIDIEGQTVPLIEEQLRPDNPRTVMKAVAQVPLDKVIVDERYQRDLDEARAQRYAREWTDSLAGVITTSARKGGKFAALDGQHRLRAAHIRGLSKLVAEVYIGLTPTDEAFLFRERNKRRVPVHPLNDYNSALFAEDPWVTEINRVVHEQGFHIPKSYIKKGRNIVGIKSLYILTYWGVLAETLYLIKTAWFDKEGYEEPIALERQTLLAVGTLAENYGESLDRKRWAQQMPSTKLRQLTSDARAYAGANSIYMLARFLLDHYNLGLKANRLNPQQLDLPPLYHGSDRPKVKQETGKVA